MFDLVIIGGGPGGYVAGIYAGQRGLRTALVENGPLGGTCLNVGCIPTKVLVEAARRRLELEEAAGYGLRLAGVELDWAALLERQEKVVAQLTAGVSQLLQGAGVQVFRGTARWRSPGEVEVGYPDGRTERLATSHVVIATGARTQRPPIEGLDLPGVITSDQAIRLSSPPRSMAVIGGGVIGMELASLYAAFGTRVSVIELLPRVLPTVDEELVRRLVPALRRRGLEFHTGARVTGIAPGPQGLQVSFTQEEGEHGVDAECILIATGRVADPGGLDLAAAGIAHSGRGIAVGPDMRTSAPGVFAIGDVTGGPQLAHVASAQALVAVDNILGGQRRFEPRAIPSVAFTLPEVAGAGLTEEGARERGMDVALARFPFSANGKALTQNAVEGLVKLVAERTSGQLVGIHILGPHASDLVAEGVLAIEQGLTAEAVARTIHAHPTLPEAVMEAAHGVHGQPIHLLRPRRA